jgi:hypothetical protein
MPHASLPFPCTIVGLVSALDWFANTDLRVTDILSVPSGTPFVPDDLGSRPVVALKPNTLSLVAPLARGLHRGNNLWPLTMRH